MPKKHIYIRDEDVAIFDKAEELFGEDNFSAMIAEAVGRYVKVEEVKKGGMAEQEISVGTYHAHGSDDVRRVRFVGKEIADACTYHGQTSDSKDRGVNYSLYLTKKGKILLHWLRWSKWEGSSDEAHYKVHDSLADVDDVPGSLITQAREALGLEAAEYLDV